MKTDTRDIDFHEQSEHIEKPIQEITVAQIDAELAKLIPSYVLPIPSFSAKKVAGKRMYKSAREGKEIKVDREM